MDVLALVMPSCTSGATSPSCLNVVKTEAISIYRHHVEPRGQLYVPSEPSFLPVKYVDAFRQTKLSWKTWKRASLTTWERRNTTIPEDWKRQQKGHVWVNGRVSKSKQTFRFESVWPSGGPPCLRTRKNSKTNVVRRQTPKRCCTRTKGYLRKSS